jgi:hypothetical protein
MVYYDRYFIQEALFVFFSFAAIACAWAYLQRPGWLPALLLGCCLGLMHATKETCVVVFAAMAGAFLLAWFGGRLRGETFGVVLHPRHAIAAIAVAGAVSVLFFSSFFTHPRGPLDSILTYFTYTGRAEGAGSTAMHEQPWYYYLQTLLYVYREAGPRWSEAPVVLLALLGTGVAFLGNPPGDRRLWRFLAAYTLLLTLAFSLVPYKTPWNLLIFLHGMTVLAGLGAAWLVGYWRAGWMRAVMALVLLAALAHGARLSYQGNFVYPADARNPYVYAHTSTGLDAPRQARRRSRRGAPRRKELTGECAQAGRRLLAAPLVPAPLRSRRLLDHPPGPARRAHPHRRPRSRGLPQGTPARRIPAGVPRPPPRRALADVHRQAALECLHRRPEIAKRTCPQMAQTGADEYRQTEASLSALICAICGQFLSFSGTAQPGLSTGSSLNPTPSASRP